MWITVNNNENAKLYIPKTLGNESKLSKYSQMDHNGLLTLVFLAMLPSMSTNSSDFNVIGYYLVKFVWCYSISCMRKCRNYGLRRTTIFYPQCEKKGSNILETIYVCQWVPVLRDFPCICRLTTRTLDSVRWGSNNVEFDLNVHLFLVDMQWYKHFIARFYLILQKDKMVHKRTPYTIDAVKSVKIMTAFHTSGDVNILILTYASFNLSGGLMPSDIITSFVYAWIQQWCVTWFWWQCN